jgi:hypothetical protein
MKSTLGSIVPWGRLYDEYVAMFSLTGQDLASRILGCGDGPASFNATLTSQGGNVVSIDPIYEHSAAVIEQRIEETRARVMAQAVHNMHEFVWDFIPSLEELERIRMSAMHTFLRDYPAGLAHGRYRVGRLPKLACADGEFDLALCSHLLFLYSDLLSLEFHLQSIRELVRVAREVRIFPLLEFGSERSRHLDRVLDVLTLEGLSVRVERVSYEFQRGGNEMLRVKKVIA